jgi:hypothetical protein
MTLIEARIHRQHFRLAWRGAMGTNRDKGMPFRSVAARRGNARGA